jgi:hypothetical protein
MTGGARQFDIGTFFVNEVIIHRIPKARRSEKDASQPILSGVASPLTQDKKNYFRKKIVRTLEKPFQLVHDPDAGSPVPNGIVDFFGGDGSNFVEVSQQMAHHLYACQGGNSPAGLLAVINGTIGTGATPGRCLAVLKLEMESGVEVKDIVVGGKPTVSVEIQDITLAESTKVFKASLFPRCKSLADLEGRASDNQQGLVDTGEGVAEFWLGRFLGCKLRQTADVATRRYLDLAEDFINELPDEGLKVRYQLALMADLSSPGNTINPREFAQRFLEPTDRDRFERLFREPDGSVPQYAKETTLVRSRLKTAVLVLDNGVRVMGPPDAVEQAVEVSDGVVTVRGSVRSITGGRAPRSRNPVDRASPVPTGDETRSESA